MKIVRPCAELMRHDGDPYKFIEKVGRTCYKSEANITDESATKFVEGLVKRKHGAMLEHEWIYISLADRRKDIQTELYGYLTFNNGENDNLGLLKYIHFGHITDPDGKDRGYAAASFRTWIQLLDDFYANGCKSAHWITPTMHAIAFTLNQLFPAAFVCYNDKMGSTYASLLENFTKKIPCIIIPREDIERSLENSSEPSDNLIHTVLFVCDRGVSHEFVRHRPASFGQESTRYCNYTKGQFDSEITVIEPLFWDKTSAEYATWKKACEAAEEFYFELIKLDATAQEARSVLPNSLKTEIFITATEKEWQHIVNLRYHGTTGAPHPQMKEVMVLAYPMLQHASNGRIK